MSTVKYAAFDPLFWLHHCNVDRLYESYITLNPDSKMEFQSFQDILAEGGGENLYEAQLAPFEKSLPEASFDTKALGTQHTRHILR